MMALFQQLLQCPVEMNEAVGSTQTQINLRGFSHLTPGDLSLYLPFKDAKPTFGA